MDYTNGLIEKWQIFHLLPETKIYLLEFLGVFCVKSTHKLTKDVSFRSCGFSKNAFF